MNKLNTTVVDTVHDELRNDIVNNRENSTYLDSNGKINIDRLVEEFGVSKTPIREAAKKLEEEGLVEHRPRRGFFVNRLGEKEVKEIMEVRHIIESSAVRNHIEELSNKASEYLKKNESIKDIERYRKFDYALHRMLVKQTNNTKLLEIHEQLAQHIRQMIHEGISDKTIMENTRKDHERLLESLAEADVEKALKMLDEHYQNGVKRCCNFNEDSR